MFSKPKYPRDIIFVDWDDTVLPSSALQAEDVNQKAKLARHTLAAIEFFRQVKQRGDCCIVTNGESGWVEGSCVKYLPGLVPEIKMIPIVSARSLFGADNPDNPVAWKYNAFSHMLSIANPPPSNVVSIGDSLCERITIKQAVANLTNGCTVKTIKLLDKPTIGTLTTQLNLLADRLSDPLDGLLSVLGGADVDITIEQPSPASKSEP